MKNTPAILALVLAFALASPAFAAIQQIRVLGVGVGRSSVAAEAAAVDYAKKRAIYLLARKMQVENASGKIAALKPEEIKRIVRGATVANVRREKEVTYADVSVSLVDTELRRILGLPPSAAASDEPLAQRNVLVLPVYRGTDRTLLWEEDNPLKESLRSEVLRQSKGAVLIPAGDFEDLRLIDHANAATVTGPELKPMFERYGAQEVIIVIVILGAEATADPTQVILRRLTPDGAMRTEAIKIPPADAKDSKEARIGSATSAVAGAITQIATATSQDEQQSLEEATRQNIVFAYANPRELGQLEEAVRHTEGVVFLEIPSITLQKVAGTVYYTGETAALKGALAKKGIVVTDGSNNWTLSLR